VPDTRPQFPHPDYAKYILEPGFLHAQELLFPHMMAANEAQALMLAAMGIIPDHEAAALLTALREIEAAGADAFSYAPAIEDLFFAVEGRLIELAGPEAGGNLQIARSRNDLAAALGRMMIRRALLSLQGDVLLLRATLVFLAQQHIHSIMPGITHTQPAQPTTLAHYLMGVLGPLERDSARLRQAYVQVNRSPLGVAAFTTSSFPIDREMTASLLGFDGYIENGYDAVGTGDHLLETTQALVTMVGSLSRFVYDLLIWTRAEVGILRIGDEFIQISSIMPQKRNPVVLEHIRIRAGYVYGDASTVSTMIHSSAFGDTNDVEDQVFVPVARSFAAAESVLRLLDDVLQSATWNTDLLAERAQQGNMTTTAVADGLVRDFGLSFRSAHSVLSRLVSAGVLIDAAHLIATVEAITGQQLAIDQAWVDAQLDPWAFIEARAIPGGPAPVAMQRAIDASRQLLARDQSLLDAAQTAMARANADISAQINKLVTSGA
jgi:argininosuccinate lyase